MEGGKGVKEKKGTNEVVLQISGTDKEHMSSNEESRVSELTESLSHVPMSQCPQGDGDGDGDGDGEVKLAEENTQLKSTANSPPKMKATDTPRSVGTPSEKSCKKWTKLVLIIKFVAFVCIVGFLIASFTVDKLEDRLFWGLEPWKWCVLALVALCGKEVTKRLIDVLVLVIENKLKHKQKVQYFVYGINASVHVLIWFGLILLAWALLFDPGVKRSRKTSKILSYVTRSLGSCLIGAAIWVVKNLLLKLLAFSFQFTRFFDRIQDAVFCQNVLRTLSGPPLMKRLGIVGKKGKNENKEGAKAQVLEKRKQEISVRTIQLLTNAVRGSELSIIDDGDKDKEITSEWEAWDVANDIFLHVAMPGSDYIEEHDLLGFMNEEVDMVLALFGEAESRKIKRKSFRNWLVNIYLERKSLVQTLNDTKAAIEELNTFVSWILLPVILIVWLLLMGFLTTHILVALSSQLVLYGFMFGSTAKTVVEGIIFVFVMHPFDVGDRCVVEGSDHQMIVEKVNLLTTIFLRYDNEKISYPNSLLACKRISNYSRCPEMRESVEFCVDVFTSADTIEVLEEKIKEYLESKPEYWRSAGQRVVVKDIDDVDKKKIMGLYVRHAINFHYYGDKISSRSELVLELEKMLEDLGIKYHLLPQHKFNSAS